MRGGRVMGVLLAVTALLALDAGTAGAQSFGLPAPPDPKLSRRDVSSIVEGLAELMATSYVDSALGAKARRKLTGRLKAGAYRQHASPRPLVADLMADVQSVIADAHFNILYFPPDAAGFRWVNSGEGAPAESTAVQEARGRLRSGNYGVAKAEVLEGNLGWLTLSKFEAPPALFREPLAAAFDLLRNTDALIIDLRKNPGGLPESVQLAFSYFMDGPERVTTTEYWRGRNERAEFKTVADPGGAKYLGRPVYVLTSQATGSGAEMFCYQMKNYRKATLVGDVTSGAAHSFNTYKIGPPHAGSVMVLLPDGRMIDALTGGDWEKTGVAPDVPVSPDDAPATAIRLALEALVAGAKTDEARAAYQGQLDKLAFVARHGEPRARDLEKYVGRYGIRRVFVENGRLKYQRDNGPPVDLEAVAEDTFELNVAMSPKPRVRFEVEAGAVRAMLLRQPGGEERIERAN